MSMAFAEKDQCPPVGKDPECDSETQLFCKGGIGWDGCQESSYCMDIADPDGVKDFNGNYCQRTSCPTNCDWEKEIMCPNEPPKKWMWSPPSEQWLLHAKLER